MVRRPSTICWADGGHSSNWLLAPTFCHVIGESPCGLSNNLVNLRLHLRRGKRAQTFVCFFKMAVRFQTGRAGEIQAQNIFELADRKSTRLNSSHANISYA